MGKTKIDWATHVWNPTVGCTAVTNGCRNCYAKRLHDQRHEAALDNKRVPVIYLKSFENVQSLYARLDDPVHWRPKPRRRVFVDSMSDLFHHQVETGFIARVFVAMALASSHQFLILTKRPDRAYALTDSGEFARYVKDKTGVDQWPLPNVWIGASVSNQADYDKFMPLLAATKAAGRFLSVEPMLGPVDLGAWWQQIDWVICGGESGPKNRVRPMHERWAQSLRDQCVEANIPFFFKQWGDTIPYSQATQEQIKGLYDGVSQLAGDTYSDDVGFWLRVPKAKAGHLLDGIEWRQYPEGLDGEEFVR